MKFINIVNDLKSNVVGFLNVMFKKLVPASIGVYFACLLLQPIISNTQKYFYIQNQELLIFSEFLVYGIVWILTAFCVFLFLYYFGKLLYICGKQQIKDIKGYFKKR